MVRLVIPLPNMLHMLLLAGSGVTAEVYRGTQSEAGTKVSASSPCSLAFSPLCSLPSAINISLSLMAGTVIALSNKPGNNYNIYNIY